MYILIISVRVAGVPIAYGKTGRKTRQGETERTNNDRQSCSIDEYREDNICNFYNQVSGSLGRAWSRTPGS